MIISTINLNQTTTQTDPPNSPHRCLLGILRFNVNPFHQISTSGAFFMFSLVFWFKFLSLNGITLSMSIFPVKVAIKGLP